MTEDEKRKFDALAFIEDQLWKEIENKVKLEWKLSFSIWGAQLASVATVVGGKVQFGKIPLEPVHFAGIIIFILIIFHASFLVWIQSSLQNRSKSRWKVRSDMEKLIATSFQFSEFSRKIWKQVSMYVQFFISLLLGVIFLIAVSATSINQSESQNSPPNHQSNLDAAKSAAPVN